MPEYPGVDAGRIKYMYSPVDDHFKGLLKAKVGPVTTMPRIVISFPDRLITNLALSYHRSQYRDPDPKREKKVRTEAIARLEDHPAKAMYLSQILIALEAQIAILERRQKTASSAETADQFGQALWRAEQVAGYIRPLLAGAKEATGNEWLEEAYNQEFGRFQQKENGTT